MLIRHANCTIDIDTNANTNKDIDAGLALDANQHLREDHSHHAVEETENTESVKHTSSLPARS